MVLGGALGDRIQGPNPLADVWPFYHTGTFFLPQSSDVSVLVLGGIPEVLPQLGPDTSESTTPYFS